MTSTFLIHSTTQKAIDAYLRKPFHAVVLAGSIGLGKTHIARITALELLGVSALENQPYYFEVGPEKSVISIEQVRQLTAFFRLAVPGKKNIQRVAVLLDADTMGREAQNALLKLLEEPPRGSALLLTSSNLRILLPTIRSRLQVIDVQTPDQEALRAYFKTKGHALIDIDRAIMLGNSSIARIEQILQGSVAEDTSVDIVKRALSFSTFERLLLVDALSKDKSQAMQFVDTLLQIASASIHTASLKQAASLQRWHGILAATYTAQDALQRNGNTKLVLNDLMLSL